MIFLDTETCGLHGPIVLLQYAEGDGEIVLHSVWKEPIIDTLRLIERIASDPEGVVGFNLAFDWFHICQLYTTLRLLPNSFTLPEDYIEEYALLEPEARLGPCLKPAKACDVMLHARRGPYQSTMARKPITIRRVPTALAWELAAELEERIKFRDIYFARRKKSRKAAKWQVKDIKGTTDFKNLELKFHASTALKALAADLFNREPDARLLFHDIALESKFNPEEKGWAPFALAVGKPGNWKHAWPSVIEHHIDHWTYDSFARKYAGADVEDTRAVWKAFGSPEPGDDDSTLACMVGACRWRGYSIDVKGLKRNKREATQKMKAAPMAPKSVRAFIMSSLDEIEKVALGHSEYGDISTTTKKTILEEMATGQAWIIDCQKCEGKGEIEYSNKARHFLKLNCNDPEAEINVLTVVKCIECNGSGKVRHPAGVKAQMVLDARRAKKEIELYDKLIEAGRFHASFSVIGTRSYRMAGSDQLNPQGINHQKKVRENFPLADADRSLDGGDFESFEVTIACAVYNDEKLNEAIKQGKSIHGIFGTFCYGKTYEEIIASKNTVFDMYTRAKSGFFAKIYKGNAFTLKDRLGIDIEKAEKADKMFEDAFPGVKAAGKRIYEQFCSMRQPVVYGPVEWHEPADYVETMFGDRRYFTLENQICKSLYDLAQNPPKHFKELKGKVVRRDRVQTLGGATQSALFGAAFQIQAKNMRAAGNHEIQSAGARITKYVQRKIWDLQPAGVNDWLVQPMNVHDEILSSNDPSISEKVKAIVHEAVEHFRPYIPLIGMGWKIGMKNWAAK